MEIKVDLHAAERGCNLVDDPRDKLFDVESGGNALRELLQANQFRELQGGRFRRRERPRSLTGLVDTTESSYRPIATVL
jgi:hypothetical protein